MMIDRDVAEKYENKVGLLNYQALNTHWPLTTSLNAPFKDHTQQPYLLATHSNHTTSNNYQPYISFAATF